MLTLLPDLNVAPLKYAHVHREHGGPIHSLSFGERDSPSGKVFDAFAFLDADKLGLRNAGPGPHGLGSASAKPDAVHIAISRAIETWAWRTCLADKMLFTQLRLDVDATNFGFAAFPGLGVQGARKRALFKAAQKWALCAWWEGTLPHSPLPSAGANALSIKTLIPGVNVAILWAEANGLTSFGVGASYSPVSAAARARTHLERTWPEGSIGARRAKYFSSGAGLDAFKARLGKGGTGATAPSLILDSAVMGPWHQYAHVWRCLFDCSGFREKDKEDYFSFY